MPLGALEQMVVDGRIRKGCAGAVVPEERFWDNLSGKELSAEGVVEARKEEMKEFRKHEVYTNVKIEE